MVIAPVVVVEVVVVTVLVVVVEDMVVTVLVVVVNVVVVTALADVIEGGVVIALVIKHSGQPPQVDHVHLCFHAAGCEAQKMVHLSPLL